MTELSIPDFPDDVDALSAALAYAECGWYLLPVRRGTKDPGSVLGKGWQHQSSRDPKQIAAWFAGTDYGIALHCGRSGAVVFDVDDPKHLPNDIANMLVELNPPYQSTRDNGTPGRGHYITAQPDGRRIGNSTAKLPGINGKWGDVRGTNGVIIVAPSEHPDKAAGGLYRWGRTGIVPTVREDIAAKLSDSGDEVDSATDAEVARAATEWAGGADTAALDHVVTRYENEAAVGSRHETAVSLMTYAAKEARAGLYPLSAAVQRLGDAFGASVAGERNRAVADEWRGIVAYAVGTANADDSRARRYDYERRKAERVAERDLSMFVPSSVNGRGNGRVGLVELTQSVAPHRQVDPVQAELDKLRVREQARRLFRAEQLGEQAKIPEAVTLTELLLEPLSPTAYRIEQVWPLGSRIILAAKAKSGKTTLVGNVVRSLVDGSPLLGSFEVSRTARVGVLDFEMHRDMVHQWLADQGIRNTDNVTVFPLRGKASTFDILDVATRREWAAMLRERNLDVLVLDCLRPVLDALGLSEDKEAGRFLVHFDELLNESDISDALTVHHMGHSGERSRGDTRIRDWPDVEWKLLRDEEQPGMPRYFGAFGRDVNVNESELGYNSLTRHLTLVGGTRKDSAMRDVMPDLLKLLASNPDGLTGNGIEREMKARGHGQKVTRATTAQAIKEGRVITRPGKGPATLHFLKINSSDESTL